MQKLKGQSAQVIVLLLCLISSPVFGEGGVFDEVADVPGLPRVLLIGDSISIDYTLDTREMLKGMANVHRPACNCMFSGNVAENIKTWLGEEKWDVVHFNAGIWDCHFVDANGNIIEPGQDYYDENSIRTTPSQYKENLNKIVDAILASGAKPIFATTTSIPAWNDKRRAYLNGLNEIAKEIMLYKQVQVNDLYTYSLPHLAEWQLPDQVHFNPLGKKQLARKVSEEILGALGSQAKILDWAPEKGAVSTMSGREVVRYNQDCIERWGYAQPRTEFFYVMKASKELHQNPLVVFLHSAGGDAEKELADNVERVAGYGDEFVGLAVNSPSTLDEPIDGMAEYDWWWGAKAIEKHPELYKDKMTRVESRVLDTIEWVVQNYNIDRNRIYLRGISMGGSGTLGIGLAHGDVFAALQADVFAGVEHAVFRLKNAAAEPPYAVMLFSQLDGWSKGAEQLLDMINVDYLGMSYAWDIYGHDNNKLYESADQAVVNFPWLSIRRNQAYPVFTNATSNDHYPGNMNQGPDQRGQVNAYFRWSVLEDTADRFIIELSTVNRVQFVKDSQLVPDALKKMQQSITTDVTLRRLQNFIVSADTGKTFQWVAESSGEIQAMGDVMPNPKGLLTINKIEIGLVPVKLMISVKEN